MFCECTAGAQLHTNWNKHSLEELSETGAKIRLYKSWCKTRLGKGGSKKKKKKKSKVEISRRQINTIIKRGLREGARYFLIGLPAQWRFR